jgi:hypothetical protein
MSTANRIVLRTKAGYARPLLARSIDPRRGEASQVPPRELPPGGELEVYLEPGQILAVTDAADDPLAEVGKPPEPEPAPEPPDPEGDSPPGQAD